ncbi:MAG: TonB-dependent receptor [Chitinophagaceae bacterium]|nr:TonB-dependent receptor [Chitinophagaceae bacterium]
MAKALPGNHLTIIAPSDFKEMRKYFSITVLLVCSLPVFAQVRDTLTSVTDTAASKELETVTITADRLDAIRKQPLSVSVIDVKKFHTRSMNAVDILGTVSGVRVRQQGGLGSNTTISLNGIAGKQVRYFLDGIPLEFMGSALAMNNIPSIIIDRMEVYKGVVPVSLGADALGGAIQLVSRRDHPDYLDASYQFGSFHTHKASVNGRHTWNNKYFASLSSFYNFSKNDYKIDVEIPNQYGNPVPARVKRFHDGFSSFRVNAEAGMINQRWADLFSVTLNSASVDKDIQHNLIMTQPYGAATTESNNNSVYIKWMADSLLKYTRLNFFAGYNNERSQLTDSTLNAYTWDGKIANRRSYGGEFSSIQTNLKLHTRQFLTRFNASYSKDNINSLNLNIVCGYFTRSGKDDYSADYYGEDIYENATTLKKLTAGLGYEKKFQKLNLTAVTAAKLFLFNAGGYSLVNNNVIPISQSRSRFGFSEALKWQPVMPLIVKVSYEYATRIPDAEELFGDFSLIKQNAKLKPETSHNINLGIGYNQPVWSGELNAFYRRTDDIIYLQIAQYTAQYQNLLKSAIAGMEASFLVRPAEGWQITVNGTYQDIRNKTGAKYASSPESKYYNDRLPNIPYLFGNAEINWRSKAGPSGNTFQCWINGSYVHEFYLYWASDGNPDLKVTIPSQYLQHMGASYAVNKIKTTITGEIHNLFDEKAFDNFNVQRPGRSFHIKLNFLIR